MLAMLAFAGNSLLCRVALRGHQIDPASFTSVRIASGAFVLFLICLHQRKSLRLGGSWMSAGALFGYAAAFSFSYTTLSAGLGALILFGSVQVTMISYGLWRGERLSPIQIAGLSVALGGLFALCAPGLSAPSFAGAVLMLVAGTSWGVYSLRGRYVNEPTLETAGNFLRAVPIALVVSVCTLSSASASGFGLCCAVLSGALTSGVGYAIWYAALRDLTALTASTVQLSVPVIAALGAILFLGEPLTGRLIGCAAAIIGGLFLMMSVRVRR